MKKFYLLVFALLIIISSCEKEEETIVGVWERIFIEGSHFTREWHFFDNNELIIKDLHDDTTITYHAFYRIKPIFKETYLAINGLDGLGDDHWHFITYNTNWIVDRLDDEVLVIYHKDNVGVLLREFIRIE